MSQIPKITSIHMSHAWEGVACDRSDTAKDSDIKMYGVDMCRVNMEAEDIRIGRASRHEDPCPLWHELVASARAALGSAATERDVREYAIRLKRGLPPHKAMPPVQPEEWARARGLVASWLYRSGMSEEGLEKYITEAPKDYYPEDVSPSKVSPGVLVELVRAAYTKEIAASIGAPFLTSKPCWWLLDSDRSALRSKDYAAGWASSEAYTDLLLSNGVDLALLREERLAAEPPFVYVPWETHFAQALAELGPRATEREVNQRAAVLHYAPTSPPRPPWEICLERARMALGQTTPTRPILEYAARLRAGLKPHAGDVLSREAWLQRQTTYLVSIRFNFRFWFDSNAEEDFVSRLVDASYLDAPKADLKAELLAGYRARKRADEEEQLARSNDEARQRNEAKAEIEAMLGSPTAPALEAIHRAACEYRVNWGREQGVRI